MGAELTQHPNLVQPVVSFVGLYDMLGVELDPNGSFNVPEYGTVQDPDMFKAMYAYSPYHHVVRGAKYPAALFVTGDNDDRVNPAHSRKMVPALQAVDTSGLPILLRTNFNAGHRHQHRQRPSPRRTFMPSPSTNSTSSCNFP
jgi:prolyl oligopeptidase